MLTYTRNEEINGEKVEATYIGKLQNGGLEISAFREVNGNENPYPIENVPDHVLQQWSIRLKAMKNRLQNDEL